jgi:hypothetical protein
VAGEREDRGAGGADGWAELEVAATASEDSRGSQGNREGGGGGRPGGEEDGSRHWSTHGAWPWAWLTPARTPGLDGLPRMEWWAPAGGRNPVSCVAFTGVGGSMRVMCLLLCFALPLVSYLRCPTQLLCTYSAA